MTVDIHRVVWEKRVCEIPGERCKKFKLDYPVCYLARSGIYKVEPNVASSTHQGYLCQFIGIAVAGATLVSGYTDFGISAAFCGAINTGNLKKRDEVPTPPPTPPADENDPVYIEENGWKPGHVFVQSNASFAQWIDEATYLARQAKKSCPIRNGQGMRIKEEGGNEVVIKGGGGNRAGPE
jgi:hypothetical protein